MAKKSREFSELVRQQKWEKASNKSFEKLQKTVKQDFGEDVQMVRNMEGLAKMSEVLKDFIRPYADIPQNKKELQRLLETAVTAWDLAFMPKEKRESELDQMFASMLKKAKKNIDKEDLATSRALIEDFIDRKLKYFADEQRQVIDFQVEYLGRGEYHLSVASAMSNPST
jgi:predicted RNA-binding protein with RPS1 domain